MGSALLFVFIGGRCMMFLSGEKELHIHFAVNLDGVDL